jgi:hypothetical protein
MCPLSRNLGASTSWNPKDLSGSVMGLLYLYFYISNRRKEGNGILNCMYQTQFALNLILSAAGPPTSLEGWDDNEIYCDSR